MRVKVAQGGVEARRGGVPFDRRHVDEVLRELSGDGDVREAPERHNLLLAGLRSVGAHPRDRRHDVSEAGARACHDGGVHRGLLGDRRFRPLSLRVGERVGDERHGARRADRPVRDGADVVGDDRGRREEERRGREDAGDRHEGARASARVRPDRGPDAVETRIPHAQRSDHESNRDAVARPVEFADKIIEPLAAEVD